MPRDSRPPARTGRGLAGLVARAEAVAAAARGSWERIRSAIHQGGGNLSTPWDGVAGGARHFKVGARVAAPAPIVGQRSKSSTRQSRSIAGTVRRTDRIDGVEARAGPRQRSQWRVRGAKNGTPERASCVATRECSGGKATTGRCHGVARWSASEDAKGLALHRLTVGQSRPPGSCLRTRGGWNCKWQSTRVDRSRRNCRNPRGRGRDARCKGARAIPPAYRRAARGSGGSRSAQRHGLRASGLRSELESLRDQIAAAVGLGGRGRKAASHSERARLMVTKAIKAAIAKIRIGDASLGRYLATSIRRATLAPTIPTPCIPCPGSCRTPVQARDSAPLSICAGRRHVVPWFVTRRCRGRLESSGGSINENDSDTDSAGWVRDCVAARPTRERKERAMETRRASRRSWHWTNAILPRSTGARKAAGGFCQNVALAAFGYAPLWPTFSMGPRTGPRPGWSFEPDQLTIKQGTPLRCRPGR